MDQLSRSASFGNAHSGKLILSDKESGPSSGRGDCGPSTRTPPLIRLDKFEKGDIKEAVRRLCSSRAFLTARRARDLILYLVEETLEGRESGINEYSIAQDVFGRDMDFDPRVDTCVRTEAWRLRRRLGKYYETEGVDDTMRIVFTPRSLVPVLTKVKRRAAPEGQPKLGILLEVSSDSRSGEDGRELKARLVEEITSTLSRIPTIIPVLPSRDSGSVDYRLRASIHWQDSKMRVAVSFIDAREGKVFAIEMFTNAEADGDFSAIAIAEAAADMIARTLSGDDSTLTIDLLDQADKTRYIHRLLCGSESDRSRQLGNLRQLIHRYEMAIGRDPKYCLSHRRLVAAYALFLSLVPSAVTEIMPKLRLATNRALSMDNALSDVWINLGLASSYAYDWPGAEQAFRQAIAAAPVDPTSYILLALIYMQTGRSARALEMCNSAMLLDPLSPVVLSGYALALNCDRQFSRAVIMARRGLDIAPDLSELRLTIGDSELQMGNVDIGVQELDQAYQAMPENALFCGMLGYAYGRSGETGAASRILARVTESPNMRAMSSAAVAMIELGLGNHNRSLDALGDAVRKHSTLGLFIPNAMFDPLRGYGQFRRIERRMGIIV